MNEQAKEIVASGSAHSRERTSCPRALFRHQRPRRRDGRSEGKRLACVSPALSCLICPSRAPAPGSPLRINRAPRCPETCPRPQVHRDGPSFQSPLMQEHQRRADRTGLTLSAESLPAGGLRLVWEPGFQEGSRHATRHEMSGSPCLRHLGNQRAPV